MTSRTRHSLEVAGILAICITAGALLGAFDVYGRQYDTDRSFAARREAREAVAEDTPEQRWARARVGAAVGAGVGVMLSGGYLVREWRRGTL